MLANTKARRETEVHAHLAFEKFGGDPSGQYISFRLENNGRSGFFVESIDWSAAWREDFLESVREALPQDHRPPKGQLFAPSSLVPASKAIEIQLRYPHHEMLDHFAAVNVDGYRAAWIGIRVTAQCRSDLGGEGRTSCIANIAAYV